MRELVPTAAELIAFVVYPDGAAIPAQIAAIQAAAQAIGQRILVVSATTPAEIDQAFATIVQHNVGSILYSAHQFFQVVREQLVALATRYRLPAMYEWREFVTAGGLVSYSTNRGEAFRQMGVYVGRILKGEKPADLPVVQPTKFELVINLKTAKALGLSRVRPKSQFEDGAARAGRSPQKQSSRPAEASSRSALRPKRILGLYLSPASDKGFELDRLSLHPLRFATIELDRRRLHLQGHSSPTQGRAQQLKREPGAVTFV